jgi:hypothetical protein
LGRRKNEGRFADAHGWPLKKEAKMKHPSNDHKAKAHSAVEHHDDHQLSDEQVAQVIKFIEQVGGVANARAAIGALEKLRRAA